MSDILRVSLTSQTGWETPSTTFLQKKPGSAWRFSSPQTIMFLR